jgi:hypothetical protein
VQTEQKNSGRIFEANNYSLGMNTEPRNNGHGGQQALRDFSEQQQREFQGKRIFLVEFSGQLLVSGPKFL